VMFVQQLDGKWELRQAGSEETITGPVPGCVHLDLMRAKIIEDPFYGDNEFKVACAPFIYLLSAHLILNSSALARSAFSLSSSFVMR